MTGGERVRVDNVCVYGLNESVRGAKFPMSVDVGSLTEDLTDGIKALAQSPIGEGHDNWLNGVVVQFDLTCTNKMWVEMERYHFIDFVSSQSTMHRAAKMDFNECFNGYVTAHTKMECNRLKQAYIDNPCAETYLTMLYNLPSGMELTARMTTNYRQLKTIYRQRREHRLPEWREFCRWIEGLPMSELIIGEAKAE
jgi:hypothetical protein